MYTKDLFLGTQGRSQDSCSFSKQKDSGISVYKTFVCVLGTISLLDRGAGREGRAETTCSGFCIDLKYLDA